MTEKDFLAYATKRLSCVIEKAMKDGIPITRSRNYRAVPKIKGMITAYWDYRRRVDKTINSTYALDLIIVGTRVFSGVPTIDCGKLIMLPNEISADAIDHGFQGHDYGDYHYKSELTRKLWIIGRQLKNTYGF